MEQRSHRHPKRRLPAYAADLVVQRQQGLAPRGDLLISMDWRLGRAWAPWRIVVDAAEDPKRFDFAVCAGLSCLLVGRDEGRLVEVARAVIPYDPLRLIGAVYSTAQIVVFLPSCSLSEGWS